MLELGMGDREIAAEFNGELDEDAVRYQVRKLRRATASELGLSNMSRTQLVDHFRELGKGSDERPADSANVDASDEPGP